MKIYDAKQQEIKEKIPIYGIHFIAVIDNLSRLPVNSHGHNLARTLVAEIGYESIDEFFTTHEC